MMPKILQCLSLAFLVALAIIAPALAVVTTRFALTNTAWTDLGTGPMLLTFNGLGVFAISDTSPSIPLTEGFTIISGESFDISTTSHVWGMAKSSSGINAYVAPTTQ
jgi:hypothetical protein